MKGNKNAEARTDRDQPRGTTCGTRTGRAFHRNGFFDPDAAYYISHFSTKELNNLRWQFDRMAADADAAGAAVLRDTYRKQILLISTAIQTRLDRANETPAQRRERRGVTAEISSAEAGEILRRPL